MLSWLFIQGNSFPWFTRLFKFFSSVCSRSVLERDFSTFFRHLFDLFVSFFGQNRPLFDLSVRFFRSTRWTRSRPLNWSRFWSRPSLRVRSSSNHFIWLFIDLLFTFYRPFVDFLSTFCWPFIELSLAFFPSEIIFGHLVGLYSLRS